MKPHLTLKLCEGAQAQSVPSWVELLGDASPCPDALHPAVDALLRRYRLPFIVASEYPRRAGQWTPDEIRSGLDRVYRLILREGGEIPSALIRDISLLPFVERARPGAIAMARLPDLEGTFPEGSRANASRRAIGLDEAHAFTEGDPEITVAVLDTGVDEAHPELQGCLKPGMDFVDIIDGALQFVGDHVGADPLPEDEVGHGTHVSGIVAGRGLRMPRGVAPRCRILPVRALAAMQKEGGRVGVGLIDNINSALKWAVDQGADVVNMSLGVRNEGGGLPHEEVVAYAKRKGVTIVAASGNDGQRQLYYPGALPHVIAVAAVDDAGQIAPFSTYGDQVSLAAPGVNVLSSYREHGYALSSGTSQAAPFVTGVAALMKSFALSLGRRLTDAQLKHVLKNTADKVDQRYKHPKAGFGTVNAADALRWLSLQLAPGGTA